MEKDGLDKTARWTFYTAGSIVIAMGILALLHPLVVVFSMAVFLGVGFILAGVNNLVPYFTIKDKALKPKWLLILGIIDIVFGILFISHIGLAVLTVTKLLGIWVALVGGMRIYIAFQVRSIGVGKWWIMLVSGAIMLAASVILLTNPVAAAVGVAMLTGFSLIGTGCLMIAEGRIMYPSKPKTPKPAKRR